MDTYNNYDNYDDIENIYDYNINNISLGSEPSDTDSSQFSTTRIVNY